VEMGRRRLGLLGMRSSEGVLEELWIYLGFFSFCTHGMSTAL